MIMNFLATYTEDHNEYYGTVNISVDDVIKTAREKKNLILKDYSIGVIINDLLREDVEVGKKFILWIYPDNHIFITKSATNIKRVKPFNTSMPEIDALMALADVIRKYSVTKQD